mgnify:CR=1 FL=1
MKKFIIIAIVIASAGLVAFTLMNNKKEMQEEVASLQVKSEAIPVTITELKEEKLEGNIKISGTLEPNTELALMSEAQGKVVKLYRKKGDKVSQGTLLLQTDNDLIETELIAAKAQYEKLGKDVARFEKLYQEDAITERDLEDARLGLKQAEANYKAIQKRLNNTYLKSPISGVIHEDFVEIGTYVAPGTKAYDIVDVSKLKLNIKVPESYILEIRDGQGVDITTDVHPGITFKGKVTNIAEKADNTLKYDVEIELVNNQKDEPLKAGMYAVANFKFEPKPAMVVSRKAIIGSLKNPSVFVIENGLAYQKPVTIGNIYEDKVQIIDGLKNGEQIVLTGQINLKEGTKVSTL